jgi:hypothetical protein
MTDFEEGSNDDLTSVESDRDVPNFTGNDLSQDSRSNTKILTSHMSADASVSAFQRTKRPHANHSAREDTSQGSDAGSLERDHQMSEDPSEDRYLGASLEMDTSSEIQEGNFERPDEISTLDSSPTRHEGSPRSSCRESSPGGPDSMFDSGHQRSSSDIQGSSKHFPFSQNVEDSSRSASPMSSPVVIAAVQDFHLSIMDE